MMCEFNSQSYTVVFIEQFDNTVFLESAIFGSALKSIVTKEIYSDENKKKLSVKLLCDRYVYSSHIDKTFFILRSLETPPWTDP